MTKLYIEKHQYKDLRACDLPSWCAAQIGRAVREVRAVYLGHGVYELTIL